MLQGKGFKLNKCGFQLNIRIFFMVARPWHRPPRGAGDVPSVEAFKARLHGILGSLT